MPGPVPKRSDQRRRRNAPARPVEKLGGAADAMPALGLEDVHPLAEEWYRSLSEGVEAKFYTPAMWQRARIVTKVLSDFLMSSKPSSMMYTALQGDMKSLLVDAGELRRLSIEVQAADQDGLPSNVIDYRARVTAGS